MLVGSTLGAIAKDPSKDVLVEVYAPWCGACQAFGPTYRRLAAAFENISSIVVAKMDGTVNEHPDLEIEVRARKAEHKRTRGMQWPCLDVFLRRRPAADALLILWLCSIMFEMFLFSMQHFPTLAFFPATKDSVPVPVEVDISEGIAPLVKFLEENAKVPFKTPDLARFLEEEKAEGVELEDEYADGEDEGSVSGSGVKGENILPLHEEL